MRLLQPWAGLDLSPLPFESLESVVLRFAWSNALASRELKAVIGAKIGRLQPDCERLERQTGWLLQMRTESVADLETEKGRTSDPWRVKPFRYCPICAEGLFHSFLFQYGDVSACPLHDVPLMTRCMWCDQDTPAARTLYKTPLRCDRCLEYFCGAEPRVDEFLVLKTDQGFVERRLKQVHRWTESGQARQKEATFLMSTSSRAMSVQMNKRRQDISREIARSRGARDSLAALAITSDKICLTGYICLRWSYRVRGESVQRSHQRQALATIGGVYRVVLREIERWLSAQVLERSGTENTSVITEAATSLDHWHAAALAYKLMRSHLEDAFFRVNDRTLAPWSRATLLRVPELQVANYEGRAPRLGWRATLIACFSYWYHFARAPYNPLPLSHAAPDRGSLLLVSTCELDFGRDSVYRFTDRGSASSPRRYRGSVWCRRIPGWSYPDHCSRRTQLP